MRSGKLTLNLAESALLVVDVQKGFTTLCPQELPVQGGLEIVPNLNRLIELDWVRIDASIDWHPPEHCSFTGQRENLYPPHCVMGTPGAEFVPGLRSERFGAIWRKGFRRETDAYAVTAQHPAFAAMLRAAKIRTVVIAGIAINICCFLTARDLRRAGFVVYIVEDASAGLDVPAANLLQDKAKAEATSLGIRYLKTDEVIAAVGSDDAKKKRKPPAKKAAKR